MKVQLIGVKTMKHSDSFDTFNQALKEANRLQRQHFYCMTPRHYIVTKKDGGFFVEPFSYALRNEALDQNNLFIVT